MHSLAVCTGCGRTIQEDFLYCPWCGYSRVSQEETLDVLFNRFTEKNKDDRRQKLYEMERELDKMEKELSVIALSAEMHK